MKNLNLMSMKLQFFAADSGSEGDQQGTGTEGDGEEQNEINIEDLTDEQIEAIKTKLDLKTNEEIDSIVKGKKAKWQKDQEAKQKEADRLATMNEDEKAEHEKQKLLNRIAELEKKDNFTAMSKEASKMLSEASISADDEILNFVVKDTAEDTQQAVNSFISLIDKKAEEKTKAALSGTAPRVNLTPGKQMTKSEIMAIKNDSERQKAIKENIHLFR
ncbi:DUF4355 domain-containing protein [Candidatus Enterococcus mansonii]|uniref:Phage scaffold protein n=1 Tax=Candidatus Enterococcus mansonii TaxID=1834181 RepID=A0A242CIL4_9ENTE|nr:DUF4355 domain-containing protein [Enterococcus sp. 4G2_DIV0659]OTO09622.1 hypothetical protein A5880_000301 [Enterococcus sp. 4G2_DIV0659]